MRPGVAARQRDTPRDINKMMLKPWFSFNHFDRQSGKRLLQGRGNESLPRLMIFGPLLYFGMACSHPQDKFAIPYRDPALSAYWRIA